MSQDTLTVLALKNAWNGAIAASDRLRELAPSVEQLGVRPGGQTSGSDPGLTPGSDPGLTAADLAPLHAAALAQAIAAEALRGLIEELQRKAGTS
jgi:hypothetical protein